MSDPSSHVTGYDVIGDIHGCADLLTRLLLKMGYQEHAGVYSHPSRKAIFLGDLIDRGPTIRRVVTIAKRMMEHDQAFVVIGNHEYNALVYDAYESQDTLGGGRINKLRGLLAASHAQYKDHPQEWADTLTWFRSLPLYKEFDDFRVVHACWDTGKIDTFNAICPAQCLADEEFFAQSVVAGTQPHGIVERLLRGTDLKLPGGVTITASDGVVRTRFRTKFWTRNPRNYCDVVFQPDRLPVEVENNSLSDEEKKNLVYYQEHEKPLFVGHYWRQGKPRLIRSNIACLDYGAVKQGKLVAYRFDNGDSGLDISKLCWVS